MKKKNVIILTVIAVTVTVTVTVIGTVLAVLFARGKKDTKIINLQVSEEAEAMYAEFMSLGEAEILEEGVFDDVVPYLYDRGGQELPDVTVKNSVDGFEIDGTKVYTIGGDDCDCIVLYIHGGAWTFEIDPLHIEFCDKLSDAMNAKIYMPLYPLAPQYHCDDTYQMIYKLYSQLSVLGKQVYVMGDSAGGNITLGLLHLIRENGVKMPDAAVVISPCTDMTLGNPAMTDIEDRDPSLRIYGCKVCAGLWADRKALDDPLLSAINADVSGYPKIMIFFGTNDILYPDGLQFYNKLVSAGVESVFVRAEGLFHVFPLYDLPERDASIDLITAFCK